MSGGRALFEEARCKTVSFIVQDGRPANLANLPDGVLALYRTDEGLILEDNAENQITVIDSDNSAETIAPIGGGFTVTGTNKILLRDPALSVNSSVDGQLDLAADTKILLTSPTVETSAALNSIGNLTVATNKLTVAAASGNTAIAGTLNTVGDFSVATNKATIAAASGNTALAGTLSVAALLTATLGVELTPATATATATGATTGTVAAGQTWVTAGNGGDANNIVKLPVPVAGRPVIIATTGALEVRTDTPASVSINGGSGASAESALPSGCVAVFLPVSTTAWLAFQITSAGVISGVEPAA